MMQVQPQFLESYPYHWSDEIPLPHLRVLLATSEEYFNLVNIPLEGITNKDIFTLLRGGLSVSNEYFVLKTLADISRVRLAAYAHSYQENVAELRDNHLAMFSNERNAIVMVEKRNRNDN